MSWATELARQIAIDYGARPTETEIELVAARLELVQQQGLIRGANELADALGKSLKGEENGQQSKG